MTDAIQAAQAVLEAECDKLTAALAAKGYPTAYVEIWIRREGERATAFIQNEPKGMPYVGRNGDVVDLIAEVRDAIEKTPDINAYDPWFQWPQTGEAA